MLLGSEFSGESERTARSGIIKLSAIRDVVDRVSCTRSRYWPSENFMMACAKRDLQKKTLLIVQLLIAEVQVAS